MVYMDKTIKKVADFFDTLGLVVKVEEAPKMVVEQFSYAHDGIAIDHGEKVHAYILITDTISPRYPRFFSGWIVDSTNDDSWPWEAHLDAFSDLATVLSRVAEILLSRKLVSAAESIKD